jgi:hypothetical protein
VHRTVREKNLADTLNVRTFAGKTPCTLDIRKRHGEKLTSPSTPRMQHPSQENPWDCLRIELAVSSTVRGLMEMHQSTERDHFPSELVAMAKLPCGRTRFRVDALGN